MVKLVSDDIIATRPLSELMRPMIYQAASIRAARASERAAAKGDHQAAFIEKRKQLLNHELFRRGLNAQKDVEKLRKYLGKFNKRNAKFKTIDADYIDRIREILDAYQLGPRLSAGKRDALDAAAFREWISEAQKDDGAILAIPQEILDADEKTHFRDMTLVEFRSLHDTIRNLEAQGRLVKRGINAREEMERDEIADHIEINMAGLKQTGTARRMASSNSVGWYDEALSKIKRADAAMTKIEFLLEFMDGGPNGPAQNAIFQPFVDAEKAENDLVRQSGDKFAQAFNALPKKIRNNMHTRVDIPALGRKMTRSELLHLALNAGNESNLDKVIRGSERDVIEGAAPFTEAGIMEALQDLTKEEWVFAQTIWDMFETMYPSVEAVYRKENGVAPERVEAKEIVTPHGTFRGGYFPMIYDPKRSSDAKDIEAKSALEMMQSEVTQASVFSGMTKGRTGFAAPVLLDITRVAGELQKTAHFITHYDAVRNAKKIIGHDKVRSAVVNKLGQEYYDILKSWVGQVASGHREKVQFDIIGDAVEAMRDNATVAIMGGYIGGSATTILSQPLGLFTSIDALSRDVDGTYRARRGPLRILQGILGMLTPGGAAQAMEKSKELQFRLQNSDRDIKHITGKLQGVKGRKAQVQRMMLIGIPFVQLYTVDLPTWIAAYNMGLKSNMSEEDAVNFADATVRKAQGAGSAKDLSAIMAMRGTSRAFTMFMTFFNTLYNIQRRAGREADISFNTANKMVMGGIFLYVLPSMVEALFRMQGPDEDDEEGYAEWLAVKSAFFAASTIPLVRDIIGSFEGGRRYTGSPLEGFGRSAQHVINSLEKIMGDEDKELSATDIKAIITLLGFSTGVVPSSFINRIVAAQEKVDAGDDWNIWEFFVGPKRS